MKLTAIELNDGQPMLRLEPAGLLAVRKAAKPKSLPAPPSPISSPPPLSAPPPQPAPRPPRAKRADVKPRHRLPFSHEEMRLRKQTNELRILFKAERGATTMTDEIDDAIAAAGIDPDRQYDAEELGELLRLTVAQYRQFKIVTGKFPASFRPSGLWHFRLLIKSRSICR